MPRRSHTARGFTLPLGADQSFWLLVVLLIAVFLTGGGSRHDIESLAYLRPFACVVAAVGLLGLGKADLRAYRLPFIVLAGLALIMAAQLVPLPPSLWSHLPSRDAIARIDDAVGLAGHWRPVSLSPMKTANSLASLIVPFAVLVLYCQLADERRRHVLFALVALAVIGAMVGILQLLAGPGSGLYLYEITHRGDAVGFFANRNHHTAYLAVSILICLHLAGGGGKPGRGIVSIGLLAAALLLFIAVVGNVSRGGLLSMGVALVLAPLALPARSRAPAKARAAATQGKWIWPALFAVPALTVFAIFALSQRSPALGRLLANDQAEDMRARVLPTVLEMVRTYQPWGTGFGAFEYAYRIHEPSALLVPSYLNNAHDDWLQLAIEGGTAALLLAALAVGALALRVVTLIRLRGARDDPWVSRAWLGLAVLMVFAFASVFD